ncbi:MAG: oligosaccharide flippase family protein [Acidobacteriota bacterium]|nr:oligosaccharide flippase family protein [Acidobacteriota bacterium]
MTYKTGKTGSPEADLSRSATLPETEEASAAAELAEAFTPDVERRSADWDLRQGPKNYLALVAAQIASGALSFAAVWMATRMLGSTGYGGVVAIIAASQAIGQLAVNWTSASVSLYGVQEFVQTGHISKPFWTRFWIFLPNVVLVLATSPLWLPALSSWLKLPPQAYLFVLAHFLVNAIWIHIQQGLQGAKLMRLQGSLLTFERLLVFLIIVACFVSGIASFLTVALAYIFAPMGASAAGLWALRRLILPVSGVDRDLLRRMLKFSLPLLPASLVGYMSTNYLDAFFITHYLSSAHLGVYAVVYLISGTALQLPLLVGTILIPLFITLQVDGTDDRARRFMLNGLPLLALIWGIACSFLAAIGSYAFPQIFGEQFKEIGNLLWPLMAAAALTGPVLMGYAPFSHSKSITYIAMLAAIAAALVNVILNFLLIPRFGLVGCAWATTAAFAVHLTVVIVFVHSRLLTAWGWIALAVLPPLAGAICASVYSVSFIALGVTLMLSALLALLHRKSVSVGLRMLNNLLPGGSRIRSAA